MCTSLLYRDASNRPYLGRTLELAVDLPYQVAYFPAGTQLASAVTGHPGSQWRTRHAIVAVSMPDAIPAPGVPLGINDLKVVEGLNDAGLTFSVQAYSQAGGPRPELDATRPAISAADLGTYLLGQFATVREVKAALNDLQIVLQPVAILGGLEMPFHYAVHDATGASLVIEFHHGVRTVYDNPVGVLTNAPPFSWHLTNLNNYTFLTNVDRSKARFMNFDAEQPGAGIAKAGLPASDTSVDRFIRAVFYASFAEKQTEPDRAVQMVAHIMNNFDRPRGITVDPPEVGSSHLQFQGQDLGHVPSEFTSWTSISDLERRRFFLRDGGGMNYVCIDLKELAASPHFAVRPMAQLATPVVEVTGSLLPAA